MNFTNKKFLRSACLITSLIMSGSASANLINSSFNNNLQSWGGDVVYYDTVNNIDNNNAYDVNFSNYTDNFSTNGNTVTLNTSTDNTNEYWGISLFQEFIVADDSFELSLNFDSVADYAYVTLVDENLDLVHDFMNNGLNVDISSFSGSSVSLEFGIEDNNFAYDDYLTVSNISISTKSLSVPEPSSFALFALALFAIRQKSKSI